MKVTKPALVIKLTILSHSSTQIEIKTIRNKITDNLCIKRVLDIIKSVIKLLTIMPKITGTVTTKNILTAILIMDISLVISKPRKLAELYTIKGTVITDNKLTTAVNVTDSATSPFANLVYIFDVTPPGAAAIIITPKAISGGIEIR